MKKFLSLVVMSLLLSITAFSQSGLDKVKSATSAAGFDVSKLGEGIMGKLGPALALTTEQKPSVSTLVTDFLTKKSQIIPLQQTDKAEYTNKASSLTGNLLGKLKGVLTAVQYAKMLGLKPKAADASNVLSQLFY